MAAASRRPEPQARPQLTFESWAATTALSAPTAAPTTATEVQRQQNHARGLSENVAIERMLQEWRDSGKIKVEEAEEPEDAEPDADDYKSGKPMKTFRSFHPLAGFVIPIQRLLLQLLLPLRAIRGLLEGRDDPVATATVAALCLVISAGMFVYAQFIHGYVVWFLGWFWTILLYVLGVVLFGPQNYFLVRAYAKKR